jgi:outer membrane lipoprotein-sorting protein
VPSVAHVPPVRRLDRAADLLRGSVVAPRRISYVGQLETLRFSSSHAIATIVRVEHLAPDRTRRWYLAPEALYGDYTISRGGTTFQFDTRHDRVVRTRSPSAENAVATADAMNLIDDNYRPVISARETVAGRPTISLLLVNKYTGERVMRVWIDTETKLILKKEEYRPNGAVAAETRFEELRYTGAIPPDIFTTATPHGYQVVAGRDFTTPSTDLERIIRAAGFSPVEPKYLPEGFVLVGGDQATVNSVKTLHLLYSDGLRTLSLFQNARGAAADFGKLKPSTTHFEGHDAEYVEDGPTTLLTWRETGLYFALVSDLSLRELTRIAISVVP